jgi:hypothetical protein
MKANELRIGNLIYKHKFEGTFTHIVTSKDLEIIENSDPKSILYVKNYSPIRLTEEWLVRFGFEEGQTGYYSIGDIIVSIEGQVYFGSNEEWIAEVFFVHHLQNLIHSLTQTELIFKESKND